MILCSVQGEMGEGMRLGKKLKWCVFVCVCECVCVRVCVCEREREREGAGKKVFFSVHAASIIYQNYDRYLCSVQV